MFNCGKYYSWTPAHFRENNDLVASAVKITIRSYDVTTQASTGGGILTLAALRSFVKTNATMLKPNDCDV